MDIKSFHKLPETNTAKQTIAWFCLGAVVIIRVTDTSDQDPSPKRSDGITQMFPRICVKFCFIS